MQKNQVILGCIEQVAFPSLSIETVFAKIDTGAYSGALHCNLIEIHVKHGKKVLRFQPVHSDAPIIEAEDYRATWVTSSNGHRHKRYIIDTDIIIQGKQYTISIGLANRKEMKIDALIGRRFIRNNSMLVDVSINKELDEDGGGKE